MSIKNLRELNVKQLSLVLISFQAPSGRTWPHSGGLWSECRCITELKGKWFGQPETSRSWNPKGPRGVSVYKSTASGIISGFLRILGDDMRGNIWKEAMQCSVQWVNDTLKNGSILFLRKEKWNLGLPDITWHHNGCRKHQRCVGVCALTSLTFCLRLYRVTAWRLLLYSTDS